jgi:HAMP domain-containing protein
VHFCDRKERCLKLLVKFNILLVVVFGLGLFLIAYQARAFLQEQAQAEVLRQAGLMAASALATRNYTEHYITPVIEKTTEHTTTFLPQAIPFFASTTTFDQIRQTYPDYTYKEAALNPTNLRDRATDWEADMINFFRNSPTQTELIQMREAGTGPTLTLAHPIKVESGCLQCHSSPGVAPKALIRHYGSQNGFGWNPDEVVGAQIISIPTSVPIKMAQQGLTRLLINLSVIFLAAILLIDFGLYFIVIRRLGKISHYADRISQGEMDLEQLPVRGKDEVAEVTRSFHRMHTSLKKALDLLNG